MISFQLVRHYTPVGTFGILYGESGEVCKMVERAHPAYEKDHPCIPEGTYTCTPYSSPTKGDVWLIKDVPGRTFIEIHKANLPSQLLGCLAPNTNFGCLEGAWGGAASGMAMAKLQGLIGIKTEFQLIITSFKG